MNKSENELSRANRKKKRKRSDRFLNISILIVVVLIVITASFVFRDGNGEDKAKGNSGDAVAQNEAAESEKNQDNEAAEAKSNEQATKNKEKNEENESEKATNEQKTEELKGDKELEETEEPGTLTHLPSDDSVVVETIVNTAWEPIPTKQTGEHVSKYDGKSVDWNEKKEAIAYATGNSTDSLIFWQINNGGSPKKSVSIVSTYDKSEKYRVYIEWIDQQGWKPVQVDVLNTLDLK